MIAAFLLALAASAPVPATAPAIAPTPGQTLFDPATGYRIAAYRGVIPSPPPGVPKIDDAAAVKAHHGKALFLDFTPAPGAVHDGRTNTWHLAEPHSTIPGAHWFPGAGLGHTDTLTDRWLARGLHRLTRGRGAYGRPIVAFCLADCWMSWNASWKLRRLGYRHVAWYANGIDGWKDGNHPLASAVPER